MIIFRCSKRSSVVRNVRICINIDFLGATYTTTIPKRTTYKLW